MIPSTSSIRGALIRGGEVSGEDFDLLLNGGAFQRLRSGDRSEGTQVSRSYVYRRVVTKWPDWCSQYGWADAYTDTPDWFGHDPYDEDPRPPVPKELKEMLEADDSLVSMLEAERYAPQPHLWERVKMPTVRRRQWLSRSSAKKWVSTAVTLGAEARIEKGWVIWEDELNEKIAKVKEGL